jgi:hypothetical protein
MCVIGAIALQTDKTRVATLLQARDPSALYCPFQEVPEGKIRQTACLEGVKKSERRRRQPETCVSLCKLSVAMPERTAIQFCDVQTPANQKAAGLLQNRSFPRHHDAGHREALSEWLKLTGPNLLAQNFGVSAS